MTDNILESATTIIPHGHLHVPNTKYLHQQINLKSEKPYANYADIF